MEEYDYLYKILLIGNSSVGKSSIFNRYVDNSYCDLSISTIGVDFKIKTLKVNDKFVKLQIWDTNGQERFKAITNSYYRNSHGIIVVFDITDKKSFIHLKNWFNDIDKYAKDAYKILVGNKCDLEHNREVTYEDAKEFADTNELMYIEVSAKKSINIDIIFETLTAELIKNTDKYNNTINNYQKVLNTKGYISLKEKEKDSLKKTCCKY
jgi:Ras-related protein Rab-1A